MTWGYFVLGVISTFMGRMVYEILKSKLRSEREKRFLKMVSIRFPDRPLTYISIDTSDRQSLLGLEQQLRKDFDIPQDQLDPIFRRKARKKS
jgi:hypothetical protein